MAREVLTLCREYLGSSAPETRARAVVALVADDTEASAAELVRLALAEGDAGVRARAIEAIAALEAAPRAIAMTRLDRALADPLHRVSAHDILTRLRNRGAEIPAGARSFRASFALAFAVRRASVRTGLRGFETAIYPWCFGAALVGALLTIFLISIKAAEEVVSWPLLGLIFAATIVASPALARAICADARRGDSYLDRIPGWVVEILAAGLDALTPIAVFGVVMLVIWPGFAEISWLVAVCLGLGILVGGFLFTASIRLATLSCSVRASRSWLGTLLGTGAGWGAGITAATVCCFLARRAVSQLSASPEIVALAAGLWLFALPVAAGVAAAFARLERDTVVPRDARWRFWLALPSLLAGVLLIAGWWWFFKARVPIETITVPAQSDPAVRAACERAPVRQRIHVESGTPRLKARVELETGRIVLRLWDRRQNALLTQSSSQNPTLQAPLPPGDYLLEAIDAETLPEWQLRRLEIYRFEPPLPAELFDLAQRLAVQGPRVWSAQGLRRPLGLCSDERSYALGAGRTPGSFELAIEMEP